MLNRQLSWRVNCSALSGRLLHGLPKYLADAFVVE
jgi:hypothetical protein